MGDLVEDEGRPSARPEALSVEEARARLREAALRAEVHVAPWKRVSPLVWVGAAAGAGVLVAMLPGRTRSTLLSTAAHLFEARIRR